MKTSYCFVLATVFVVLATFTHANTIPPNSLETENTDVDTVTNIQPQAAGEPESKSEITFSEKEITSEPKSEAIAETSPKPRLHNDKEYDDEFYVKFMNRDDVDATVQLALDWDVEKQHDHFKQMQHHINAKDDHARYAQDILHAAQRLLDRSLKQANYTKKHIDVEDYVNAVYARQKNPNHDIQDQDMIEVLTALNDCKGDDIERATDAGETEKEQYRLEHMRPYTEIPA